MGVGEVVCYYRAAGGRYVWLPDEGGVPQEEADQPAVGERSAALHLRDYDVGHYLHVFHASYVARCRKAFQPADFAQLFRADGQLGLFDQPLGAIAPIWIRAGPT